MESLEHDTIIVRNLLPADLEAVIRLDAKVSGRQRGEYFRILGRESDIINVGGQKVFPAEVETVLLEADNVADVTVHGERHPLMGSVVTAQLRLHEPEAPGDLRVRLRKHCLARLAPHKVPVRFRVTEDSQHNLRYKKQRPRPEPPNPPSK